MAIDFLHSAFAVYICSVVVCLVGLTIGRNGECFRKEMICTFIPIANTVLAFRYLWMMIKTTLKQ